jgi:hypothetical protein
MAHKASKARRSTGQDGLKQPTNVKKARRAKDLPLLLERLRQSSHLISELKQKLKITFQNRKRSTYTSKTTWRKQANARTRTHTHTHTHTSRTAASLLGAVLLLPSS